MANEKIAPTSKPSASSTNGVALDQVVSELQQTLKDRRAEEHELKEESVPDSWLHGWLESKVPKLVDAKVPVDHILKVKYLEEVDGHLFLIGTFVQTIVGVSPTSKHDPNEKLHFNYRFNDRVATDEQFQFRRSRVIVKKQLRTQSTTASVRIPLQKQVVFSKNPFVILKATAVIELGTFEMGNIQFRPDLVLDSDYGDTLEYNGNPNTPTGAMSRTFVSVKYPDKFQCDRMVSYDMITPFPSISVVHDTKKKYSPEFQVAFWLHEPIGQKTVSTLLPVSVVLILASMNVFAIQELGDFIANTSSIVLSLVFIIPLLYPSSDLPTRFSSNDVAIGLIFLSLLMNCIKITLYKEMTSIPAVETLQAAMSGDAEVFTSAVFVRDLVLPFMVLLCTSVSIMLPMNSYFEYKKLKGAVRDANEAGAAEQEALRKFAETANVAKKNSVDITTVKQGERGEKLSKVSKVSLTESVTQGYQL